jgi:hypothetical protein
MVNSRFILQPDTPGSLEMEEPAGWNDAELVLQRDLIYHGISVAFSNRSLELQGDAASYVKDQYETSGVDASVILRIIFQCEEQEDYLEDFSLDFNTYKEICGADCRVSIAFAENGCFTKFRNNFDKKVDLNNDLSFDGTALTSYDGLGKAIELPALPIFVSTEGNVTGDTFDIDYPGSNISKYSIRPIFGNVIYEAINQSQLSAPSVVFAVDDEVVSPLILFDDLPSCFSGEFDVEVRAKGSIQVSDTSGATNLQLDALIVRIIQTDGSYHDLSATILAQQVLANNAFLDGNPQNFDFDLSFADPTHAIAIGENITMVIIGQHSGIPAVHPVISVQWDNETYAKFETIKRCPDTVNDVYLLFETLSRIAESTTDKCLEVDSEYFGRTDSQPTAYDEDGCGALRCLTSGLYLRKAENPTFFSSMKDVIDGLRCIDNIGFGLIKVSGQEKLKIESVSYFYSDQEVLRLPFVSEVQLAVAVNEIYGTVKLGYEKWEPENINGLDEFNSTREYRLDLRLGRNTLDITCKLIAAGYVIETTRQQSFALTGAGDTKRDNDTFIICLMRDAYTSLLVEQGMDSPANLLFPNDAYNFRIRPIANLMKWFKSLSGNYRDHTTKSLIFASGTGNILAEGKIDDDCALELNATSESDNIEVTDFKNASDATPILRPESITFEYPMSLSDFLELRANPYGYISYQCGSDWLKGYVNKISYRPSNGMASFDLRKKYE